MFAVPGPALFRGGEPGPLVPSLLAEQVVAQSVVAPNSAPSPVIEVSVLSEDDADEDDWGTDQSSVEEKVR